jgi:MarR family transcriptional regulator for hemolysin
MHPGSQVAPPPAEPPKSLASNLSWLLWRASYALKTELAAGLHALGLSPRGYHVLATALDAELTQTELAEAIGLDKTTMVVTIDELEAATLAERRRSPTDRRARVIAVTKEGEKKVAEAEAVVDRIQADVLASLPGDRREVFVEALAHLVCNRLSEGVECRPPVRRREPRG